MPTVTQQRQSPSDDLSELIQAGGRKILRLAGIGILIIVALYVTFNSFEHVDQNQIMVIQYPTGSLHWFQDGGYHAQWFGKVNKYPKRSQYWFSSKDDQGKEINQAIKVRFNDGGHGYISGGIAWEMPTDERHLNMLYTKYGDWHAIEQDLVRTVTEKSTYMTGPLMSSKESYAERRNDLIRFIEDQISNGVYQTETVEKEVLDPLTNEKRVIATVQLKQEKGQLLRQETSPLADFGIRTYNLAINQLDYDDVVEKQIQQQQQAIMNVQTAIAQAKQAEQAAITAAKNGEAEAAKAKWEQEVIKARAVTEAQQQLEVAQLNTKSAEQFKQAEILKGEGEASRRKLVMAADGALDKKLDASIKINAMYAEAIKDHQGAWVPMVQMGGQGGNGAANVQSLIEMFSAKTAHDLALNMSLPNQKQ